MKSDFAESFRQSFVDFGEARPHGVTTESELAESCGKFTLKLVKLGPKKAKYTVEQIVDVLGAQFHDDIAETSCNATASDRPVRKSARLSPSGQEVLEFESGSGSSLHPLPRRRRRLPRTSGVGAKGRKLARFSLEVFEISCGSGSSAELLLDVDDLRPESDKQTPSFTTIGSEIDVARDVRDR